MLNAGRSVEIGVRKGNTMLVSVDKGRNHPLLHMTNGLTFVHESNGTGLIKGDIVAKVNGKSVYGMTLSQVEETIENAPSCQFQIVTMPKSPIVYTKIRRSDLPVQFEYSHMGEHLLVTHESPGGYAKDVALE